jgi:outer membrane receptor protein involved in Fe transport
MSLFTDPAALPGRLRLQRAGIMALLLAVPWMAARGDDPPAADVAVSAAGQPLTEIQVTAQRLKEVRGNIEPDLGASTYTFDATAIQSIPGGGDASLNQVILQAPGVAQDSFGQLHIRGEHNGIQYRLDGVILPEGISVFSQSLSPRLADSVELVSGALPAQYGLRTAGIIDITSKQGVFDEGGEVGLYGGSHGWLQPSFEYGGSIGSLNYFVSGSYLENGLGIESPDGRSDPLHDNTQQGQGFGFFEYILDADSKIAVILGSARDQFQIPDLADATPSLGLDVLGRTTYPSSQLDENQRELTDYGVVSYLRSSDRLDVQASLFGRYSSLYYTPDTIGDLLFDGIAQTAYKRDIAGGLQLEGVYRLTDQHTLRAGTIIEADRATSDTLSEVLPTGAGGVQTSDQPLTITDTGGKTAWTYSVYLQDEWRPLTDLTINFGGRFDLFDAFDHENQASPRLNIVWQASDQVTVHAGYSRYFTPPPFELVGGESLVKFANTTAAPAAPVDTTPKAEKANYWDVGVSDKPMQALTLGLDTYYKRSRDLIDEGQFGAPIILTPFNYASGKQYGVELSANYRDGPFSAYANIAGAVAEGLDIVTSQFNFGPDDLAYISDHYIHLDHDQTYSISAGASYRLDQTLFSTDLIHGSGLRADGDHPNGTSLPDYTQINLSVVQSLELPYAGAMRLRFDVVNLFDEEYEIRNGTGVGVGAPQFGPRRGFFFGVAKLF